MIFESQFVEEGIQGTWIWKQLHNNLTNNLFRFLFFPIDVMVDFSDGLHNPFSKFRIKTKFLQNFYSSFYFFY